MTPFLRRLVCWLRGNRPTADLQKSCVSIATWPSVIFVSMGWRQDAARAAQRQLGNTIVAREDARAVWVAPWIDALWQDVRHGARSLRRSPGLVIVSLVSLGLGIGLNDPLPHGLQHGLWTPADDDVAGARGRGRARICESVLVSRLPGSAGQRHLRRRGGFQNRWHESRRQRPPIPVSLLVVTANYFDVLGIRARIGRTFAAAEVRRNAIPVSSLSPPHSGGTGCAATRGDWRITGARR